MRQPPEPEIPKLKMPDQSDWHFADVPEEEVVACVFWEYGRESRLKELGPRINLDDYPSLTLTRRRQMNALLLTDGLEVPASAGDSGAPTLEGFFQEIDAWQDLSNAAKSRFHKLFDCSKAWSSTDHGYSKLLLAAAYEGTGGAASSENLMLLVTDEIWQTCSDKQISTYMLKLISEFRPDKYPSAGAQPLPGLYGDGIKRKTLRSYLTQLGAYRLMKENSPTDLAKNFSGSVNLKGLVRGAVGNESWNDLPAWSKVKKRVPELILQWFPID